jgi:hypothetical protein
MNGKSGGPATDRGDFEPAPEALDGEPGGTAGNAAPDGGKPSPGGAAERSADGPDAIDLDSVHDRAS